MTSVSPDSSSISTAEPFQGGAAHPALGDEPAHKMRRGNIKGRVKGRGLFRRDHYLAHAALPVFTLDRKQLAGTALFNGDFDKTVLQAPIHRGAGQGYIKGHLVCLSG